MKIKSIIIWLLLCATALPAIAETSLMKSLPDRVQKSIEETRAACRATARAAHVMRERTEICSQRTGSGPGVKTPPGKVRP
jgi:hypothetical protein